MEIDMATTQTAIKPVLPEWTRWAWSSVAEREWWKLLFTEATQAFQMIEKYAVVEGLRDAAWMFVPSDQLVREAEWADAHGLTLVPTALSKMGGAYQSSFAGALVQGEPFNVRVLYLRKGYTAPIFPLTDARLGALLGYPECCQKAFADTWGQHQVDNTWEQLQGWDGKSPTASTLWRWMGIRFVPHLPCSYNCEASKHQAEQYAAVGRKYGYTEQMQLINEVVHWPVKWTRLFGIMESTGPCIKLSTRTDWTGEKQEFTKEGTYFKPTADLWTDNGFLSHTAMRGAHDLLLPILRESLPPNARLLDLGCGNGMLLRRLTIHRPDVKIAGIDNNANSIGRIPSFKGKWWAGRIQDGAWAPWNPTAVLVTPGRLLEMTPIDKAYVLGLLEDIPQKFLYSYSDWQKYGTFEALSQQAGFLVNTRLHSPSVSAGIVVKS
jgi:hypothetical protein